MVGNLSLRVNNYFTSSSWHENIKCRPPIAHRKLVGQNNIRINLWDKEQFDLDLCIQSNSSVNYNTICNIIIAINFATFFSLMSFSQFSQVSQILLPWTVLRVSDLKITSGKGFSIWIGCFGSPMRTKWAPYKIKISLYLFFWDHHWIMKM